MKKKTVAHYDLCIYQTKTVLNGSDQIIKVWYCESLNIIYLTAFNTFKFSTAEGLLTVLREGVI